MVAIENIKSGDMVYAANVETLEVSLKPVLETYIRETSSLVHLTINGENIISTYDHPYYVKDKGFVSAEALWIGAELIDKNGNTLYVEQIYREKLDNQFKTVYNFKVEDYHTYFVGNNSVLVHNADYVINKSGNIEITDWEGYPENMPKPEGEMSLIKGEKYVNARKAANNENAKIHRNNPQYKGKQIHEIKPVKFNGSPIDHDNKIVLTRREHAKLTTFWKRLQLQIDKDSAINKKS